ncbi:thiopeptide-type bacteriocin biosynthesis protein [Polymorphobacter sp.]|uniref:thiopeptide-type bacteriocin biosynthesis protein n=1 Tax=Polymorphobacter sp. TaxID=1909290 RepID=UPI003F6ECF06
MPISDWEQVDIRIDDPQAAAALIAGLADWAPDALANGELNNLFFMQKPPGIRLRLQRARFDPMARLARPGIALVPGIYEPETWLFDGPAALAHAHAAFTADTLAIAGWTGHALAGTPLSAPTIFSSLLCNQLLDGLGLDAFEAWDVWMRVHQLRGGDWTSIAPLVAAPPCPVPAEQALLFDHARRIAAIGDVRPDFPAGIRSILPFWIIFHWNRMGFDEATQRRAAAWQARTRHPRRHLENAARAWAS